MHQSKHNNYIVLSEAWEPPQFQEDRSWSGKAILGAPGEFQGILGAALRVQKSILGMRNPILGMASHDLGNAKPQFSEQLLERFLEMVGTHMKDFHLPLHSRSFSFKNWGGPRAPDSKLFAIPPPPPHFCRPCGVAETCFTKPGF